MQAKLSYLDVQSNIVCYVHLAASQIELLGRPEQRSMLCSFGRKPNWVAWTSRATLNATFIRRKPNWVAWTSRAMLYATLIGTQTKLTIFFLFLLVSSCFYLFLPVSSCFFSFLLVSSRFFSVLLVSSCFPPPVFSRFFSVLLSSSCFLLFFLLIFVSFCFFFFSCFF